MLPVYVSLTSIFNRQGTVTRTLKSLLRQTLKPTKIFLFLSQEPYLLDEGFPNKQVTDPGLMELIANNPTIELEWVPNHGPFRKLLPLLKKKWDEDCLLITVDDDSVYNQDLVKNLVDDYTQHNCVINYRGFTPEINSFEEFNYSKRTELTVKDIYNFPTGKGSILYHPSFFKKSGDLIFNSEIYTKYCQTSDDIWFFIMRVINGVECYLDNNKRYMDYDLTNKGLYMINCEDNKNTLLFRSVLQELKRLGHY